MSTVPVERLRPVNALDIKSWVHKASLTLPGGGKYIIDSYTRYGAFWRSAEIRNYGTRVLRYRTNPTGPTEVMPIGSERRINGWGSYLEIQNGAANTPSNGIVLIEMVQRSQAYEQ